MVLPRDGLPAGARDANRPDGLPINDVSVAAFLRCAMGLSAWKAYSGSRWALRVNPSSGNLHPTEAYVVWDGRVCHYAPRDHVLEQRAVLDGNAWASVVGGRGGMLVALTSIQWREAWKYGERAFRYCQHDVGHAIAALRVSASLFGWSVRLLTNWSDGQIAGLLGVDRDEDRAGAEREHAECVAFAGPARDVPSVDPGPLVSAARSAAWHGRANHLSSRHVEWPIIERVTEATTYPGAPPSSQSSDPGVLSLLQRAASPPRYPREVILQRRSALAFDARSTLPRDRFLAMLSALRPAEPPFDALDWPPHVHLAVFVHRVDGLVPGLYAYLRDDGVLDEWRSAMRPEFLWERVSGEPESPLYLLVPTDVTWVGMRLSCDQDIAGAGFFSLGMIARLASSLRDRGEWMYRRLFWECGVIGQVLYLEAEMAGARGTGIGCFYDDPVHDVLGLTGAEWQSLYHFAMGMPVEDARLTSEPAYAWESA